MHKSLLLIILVTLPMAAMARNDVADYYFEEAMSISKVSSAIGEGVKFYLAGQKHGKITRLFGEFQSNKKTNAVGKSDKRACQWAFASAMKTLRERAIKEGGNAVVNIRSNYKGTLTSSSTTFQCGAGEIMAGVTLIGDVVELSQ